MAHPRLLVSPLLASRRCVCSHSPSSGRALPSRLPPFPRLRHVAPRPSRTQRFHTRAHALQQSTAPPHISSSDASGTPTIILQPAGPKRSLRPYIYSFAFLLLGLGLGQFIRAVVVPPPLPLPDTPEDEVLRAALHKDVDRLPIVTELRAQRDTWLEYAAYMDQPDTKKLAHMTAGAMSGSRGLAVQRVFWNQSEHRLINVVFLGGALTGWPGVTHGGAVATLLQENLERAANGPEVWPAERQGRHRLNEVSIAYKKPTHAHKIYLIRAEMELAGSGEHVRVRATLEDAHTGLVTAEATGRCTAGVMGRAKEEVQGLWGSAVRALSWSGSQEY